MSSIWDFPPAHFKTGLEKPEATILTADFTPMVLCYSSIRPNGKSNIYILTHGMSTPKIRCQMSLPFPGYLGPGGDNTGTIRGQYGDNHYHKEKQAARKNVQPVDFIGAHSAIRTRGTKIRNPVLYPPELWGHAGGFS